MQRRTLIKVGVATGAMLAMAGGTWALIKPGRKNGHLTSAARDLLSAVARSVLGPLLPLEPAARNRALEDHLARVQATIAGMPVPVQTEVDELLTILASAPGRLGLGGLIRDWPDAEEAAVTAALQRMRLSSLAVRQQAYHALRDLTNASYFADAATWPSIGYPGPRAL